MIRLGKGNYLSANKITRHVNGFALSLTSYSADEKYQEWHSHKTAHISLLIRGSYKELFESGSYHRVKGDIKFIPKEQKHLCYDYAPGSTCLNLELGESFLIEKAIRVNDIEDLPDLKFFLFRIYREFILANDNDAGSIRRLIIKICSRIKKAEQQKFRPAWIDNLEELLHKQWDRKENLKELAEKIGVHPVTISKYFPRYFSATLGSYRRQLKIDRALKLLSSSSHSLTKIAYECGFSDQAHFTKTFKEMTGIRPKDFRKF